ncbi:GFA family protein [Paracoccus sphaerophysae]|uniref:GFA family protein n=1 Tax=Paracoccus sphaerophysae TaxID=690417 RepID=UPI002355A76D|nr:GFA family protein [Paracoccus sphaerophysae]
MLTGGCQCGAVRYAVAAVPSRVHVCHCTECRAQPSLAFVISGIVPPAAVRLTQGTQRVRSHPTPSSKVLASAFCPDGGSRIWHRKAPDGAEMSVRGGSLDDPVDLIGACHIWTQNKLPGVVILPSVPQFPQDHD